MNVIKKDLTKSQVELVIELSLEEFEPYIRRGAEAVSQDVKIGGFRPGKVPYDILKAKIGEMTILEEAARIAINKTAEQTIKENITRQIVGRPQVNVIKLAPGNPFEYKVVLAILPEIKLGDYKNAKVKLEKTEVNEKEVEEMINSLREMQVKEILVEREIREGDKALVDIEMFLDKVPVEGGQGKGTAVVIGKDYIIPGFDKNLLGAKKDEAREFTLIYPSDHYMKNLAGKKVEFRVKVKEVYARELPVLDENFTKKFGLKSAAELKENITKSILREKNLRNEQKAEIAILDKIVEKTKFGDIPEILVNEEVEVMLHELEHAVKAQGGKFEDYLASIRKTRDQIVLDMLPEAVKRIKSALVVSEIEKTENIKVGEKELKEEIVKLKEQYKHNKEVLKRIESEEYKNHLFGVMINRKVIGRLKEWNLVYEGNCNK